MSHDVYVCTGNTALHDCAESGSLEIMKLLFTHGAVIEKDSYGLTPLLAAAVSGHARIVEYLTSLPECLVKDRIDALELLGATFVDKKRDVASAAKVSLSVSVSVSLCLAVRFRECS